MRITLEESVLSSDALHHVYEAIVPVVPAAFSGPGVWELLIIGFMGLITLGPVVAGLGLVVWLVVRSNRQRGDINRLKEQLAATKNSNDSKSL